MFKIKKGIYLKKVEILKAQRIYKRLPQRHQLKLDVWVDCEASAWQRDANDKRQWWGFACKVDAYLVALEDVGIITFEERMLMDKYYSEVATLLKVSPNDVEDVA